MRPNVSLNILCGLLLWTFDLAFVVQASTKTDFSAMCSLSDLLFHWLICIVNWSINSLPSFPYGTRNTFVLHDIISLYASVMSDVWINIGAPLPSFPHSTMVSLFTGFVFWQTPMLRWHEFQIRFRLELPISSSNLVSSLSLVFPDKFPIDIVFSSLAPWSLKFWLVNPRLAYPRFSHSSVSNRWYIQLTSLLILTIKRFITQMIFLSRLAQNQLSRQLFLYL